MSHHRHASLAPAEVHMSDSLAKHGGSDNEGYAPHVSGDAKFCGDLRTQCPTCRRRFWPDQKGQRFCDHACYSASLRVSIVDRFWTKVAKQPLDGCWLWTGHRHGFGHGMVASVVNGKRRPVYAHRVAWELTNGPIPDGLSVLHRCDVPACVRPDHLFLGTQQDNLNDARKKRRLVETRSRDGVLTYAQRVAMYHVRTYPGVVAELSRQYGISKTAVHHIRKGRFATPDGLQFRDLNNVQKSVSRQLWIRGEVA